MAGADIAEMSKLSPLEARRFAEAGQRTFERLEALPIPTIAAVNGFALGGGCELALACDLIYASEKARFGQPEVNLGVIPGFGGTQRLQRRVGPARAKELIFTGDMVDAAHGQGAGAWRWRCCPPEKLLEYALGRAREDRLQGPAGDRAAKRVMSGQSWTAPPATRWRPRLRLLFGTEDAREGMTAFVEKRPPVHGASRHLRSSPSRTARPRAT